MLIEARGAKSAASSRNPPDWSLPTKPKVQVSCRFLFESPDAVCIPLQFLPWKRTTATRSKADTRQLSGQPSFRSRFRPAEKKAEVVAAYRTMRLNHEAFSSVVSLFLTSSRLESLGSAQVLVLCGQILQTMQFIRNFHAKDHVGNTALQRNAVVFTSALTFQHRCTKTCTKLAQTGASTRGCRVIGTHCVL